MLTIKTKDQEHKVNFTTDDFKSGDLDGTPFQWDYIRIKEGSFHVIKDNKSYEVEVLKADPVEKSFRIKVNGNKYDLDLQDRFDLLLKEMGIDHLAGSQAEDIKAPMPGLVLEIKVKAGDEIKKGDPVLVLEAMKMENVLKAPADGEVKKVSVAQKEAVEKNQVLIELA